MNQEYIAFIDLIGRSIDGKYVYRFDFTYDKDIVWGEYFNITPAIIVPDLQPEKNCLSRRATVEIPYNLGLAKRNSCFSMQDCIDGIIALCFSELDENVLYAGDDVFLINFGETLESVEERLSKCGYKLENFEVIETGDDTIIDELIDNLDSDE